jgi:4'-phosphopantetheinyl transferase
MIKSGLNCKNCVSLQSDPRFLLPSGEVHIWRADLDSGNTGRNLEDLLSPDEMQRANRFRFPEHRRRFIIGRAYLRQLLSAYLAIEGGEVNFNYSLQGKPALAPGHDSNIFFNVSHSEDIAAFAFTKEHSIGVDVEVIRYDIDATGIPRRFFSSAEQTTLAALEGEAKFRGFFNCWTRKEAYVKAVGSGLSLPLRDFDVSLAPGDPARLLATRPDQKQAARWSMASLDFGQTCAAAVVVEGPITKLHISKFAPFA